MPCIAGDMEVEGDDEHSTQLWVLRIFQSHNPVSSLNYAVCRLETSASPTEKAEKIREELDNLTVWEKVGANDELKWVTRLFLTHDAVCQGNNAEGIYTRDLEKGPKYTTL